MALSSFPKMQPWWRKFARVHEWLPSRRPTYKHRATGTIVTLIRVYEDGSVDLMRSCGRIDHKTKPIFESKYIKI